MASTVSPRGLNEALQPLRLEKAQQTITFLGAGPVAEATSTRARR